ncbi:hypothetical protein ANANG_G00005390 [Anguilla anguilla]|uniref:C2H2-type domain-containing protein n=1 Tax=Anguilla anguilla TaxID=7936 RepID=A0A9D3MVS6_ANGAN|nr:hypothetical protein ANANG_G00005390 [Anguilla anguilla]
MELCQMAIKIEGDEPEKRAGVNVKEEEQESEINRAETLNTSKCGYEYRLIHVTCGEPGQSAVVACSFQGRPFQCPVCGDSFIQSHALLNHQRRHVRQSPYTCRDCPRTCQTLAQLLAHCHTHLPVGHPLPTPPATAEGPRPPSVSSLQCPRCFITFRDLQTSLQHMRLQHPLSTMVRCVRGVSSPSGTCRPACRHEPAATRRKMDSEGAPSSPGRGERTFHSSRQLSTQPVIPLARVEAGREARGKRKKAKMPTSPSLLPLPDRHKCPHCNFLFRDAKTKMRHMNVKHPAGCPCPPLLFSTGDEEREEEEEVVMAVQVKEEDEDDFSTALRHRGNLNPASPHQGEGKEGVVKVPIKPDAGDVGTKEETIEGVCALQCALCGKGFEQLLAAAGQRRRGRRREHSAPGGRGHACGHCRQLCHSQEVLRQHQRLHTLERPYLCQVKLWLLCRIAGTLLKGLRGSRGTEASTPRSSIVQPPPPNLLLSSRTDCLPSSHKSTRTVLLCGLQIQEELGEILHHNSCFPLESQHSTT